MVNSLSEQELAAWLTLSFTPNLGGQRLSRLMAIDSATNLVQYSSKSLQAIGLKEEQIIFIQKKSAQEVDAALTWHSRPNQQILTPFSTRYPPLLKEISSYPPLLFVRGKIEVLSRPQIAIVGSRNASAEGLQSAQDFAQDFVRAGLVVTSGLALGIDGYAHNGALSADGETIAVLGSGLDKIYPSRHQGLAQRIIENGALVSEFRPNAQPRAEHFPRRNRIISGLSVGVLVIEAAQRSGSLITARYALEQGRDVFALPGSIYNSNSQGGNRLIQSGASLVQNAQEVLDEVNVLVDWSVEHDVSGKLSHQYLLERCHNMQQPIAFDAERSTSIYAALLEHIDTKITAVDVIAQRANIPIHELMMQLLELELTGDITATSSGYIKKRRDNLR